MKYIIIIALLMTGCVKSGVTSEKTNNPDFDVSFLFEKDGCKVYRFMDKLNDYHYFTNCTETISVKDCGKNCTKQENIKND